MYHSPLYVCLRLSIHNPYKSHHHSQTLKIIFSSLFPSLSINISTWECIKIYDYHESRDRFTSSCTSYDLGYLIRVPGFLTPTVAIKDSHSWSYPHQGLRPRKSLRVDLMQHAGNEDLLPRTWARKWDETGRFLEGNKNLLLCRIMY